MSVFPRFPKVSRHSTAMADIQGNAGVGETRLTPRKKLARERSFRRK
jgi:hypothetical protein